jgi:hypothetical protein
MHDEIMEKESPSNDTIEMTAVIPIIISRKINLPRVEEVL